MKFLEYFGMKVCYATLKMKEHVFHRVTENSTLRVERWKWGNADEREARRTRSKVIAR